jgi:3-methyladenine DNA glycosylase/8-oxoguanine DNA glycosylase
MFIFDQQTNKPTNQPTMIQSFQKTLWISILLCRTQHYTCSYISRATSAPLSRTGFSTSASLFTTRIYTMKRSTRSTTRSSQKILQQEQDEDTKEGVAAMSSPSPKKRKSTTLSDSPPNKKSSKASSNQKRTTTLILSSDVAKISPENPWIDLQVPPRELRPSATLTTGQCFNWMVVRDDSTSHNDNGLNLSLESSSSAWGSHNETEWVGPLQDMVLSIKETPTTTLYRVLRAPPKGSATTSDISEFLKDYFQLNIRLEPLYKQWSKKDPRLARIAAVIPGVRIVRQNPVECLFSFICSSNNNIPRITKMLSSFRTEYGEKLLDIPIRQSIENNVDFSLNPLPAVHEHLTIYSFPSLEQMQQATLLQLRDMGLGYRAKYIIETRDLLLDKGGEEFLWNLRGKDATSVQQELLNFSGIGRKVADCVALFSLDQSEAIPVDVHVQHIASRDYDSSVLGQAKSLTPTIYNKVANLFRDRFGSYAGWAHSLLFVAELPSFRSVLPPDILEQMDTFRQAELARKSKERQAKKNKDPISETIH